MLVNVPKAVLMAPPEFFEVRDVKNEFMRRNVGAVDRERAFAQWEELRRVFASCGVATHVMSPLPQCEDMVFTANPSFNGRSANGERICVPGRMAFASRQPEVEAHRSWFASHGYAITELPDNVQRFEGGGDALWHPGRALIWAAAGSRTDRSAHGALASIFGVAVVSLELTDSRFYHLDTCFCALDEHRALVYGKAFARESLARIRQEFSDVIDVDEEEAASRLACNAAAFHGDTVVMQTGSERTVRELDRRGFTVRQVDAGEYLKSGGSVFCMKAGVY
jgi:arginine dihydrolase